MYVLFKLWLDLYVYLTLWRFSADATSTPKAKVERIVKKTPVKSDPLWVLKFILGIYCSHICYWQIVSLNLQRPFIYQTLKWRRSCEFCIDILSFSFLIVNFASLPPLKKCEIFSKKLVNPLLVDTYGELPKLPRYELRTAVSISALLTILMFRMADFSSTWGPPSDQGGFSLARSTEWRRGYSI